MFPFARTTIKRYRNKRNQGVIAKRKRENYGTTASLPLQGELPSLHAGRPVKADSIKLPANLKV